MCLSFYAEGNQLTTITPVRDLAFLKLLVLELGFNCIATLEPLLSIALPQIQRLSLSNLVNMQPITKSLRSRVSLKVTGQTSKL